MRIAETRRGLRQLLRSWRDENETVAFVPTMGHLHDGHMRLVNKARQIADRVIVSIFINPLQFDERNDYENYPLTLAADREKLVSAAVDGLFYPAVSELYPFGMEASVRVEVPGLSDILCGAYRPGHFVGVTTVVAKLFNLVQPDSAVFGEKDFQQLLLIRRMTTDLCLPIEIVAVETVRESAGLAMSSRNSRLSSGQREQATVIYQQLRNIHDQLRAGRRDFDVLQEEAMQQMTAQGLRPEYCQIRRAVDLAVAEKSDQQLRVLAAAWLDSARLIDNVPVDLRD